MEGSVVKVDKDLPLDVLAPLGCGIMTGAGGKSHGVPHHSRTESLMIRFIAMLNVVRPSSGSIVLVVGAGAVGLAALMALKLTPSPPSKVIAVDIVPERLEQAKKYGATDVINSKDTPDLKAALKNITDGKGVDGAIDTTGRPDVLRILLESAAKKGVVVSVGVGKVCISRDLSHFPLQHPFLSTDASMISCQLKSRPSSSIPSIQVALTSDVAWETAIHKNSSQCSWLHGVKESFHSPICSNNIRHKI